MPTLSLSALRQRIATALADKLGSSWQESSDPFDQFGAGDGDRLHKSYAVGIPASVAKPDRQRIDQGALTDSDLRVRWGYNLAALDQVASYDDALDVERLVLGAAMTQRLGPGLILQYVSASRVADGQGWVLGELVFRATHHLPLA